MGKYITGIKTATGVKKIDYNALANKPEYVGGGVKRVLLAEDFGSHSNSEYISVRNDKLDFTKPFTVKAIFCPAYNSTITNKTFHQIIAYVPPYSWIRDHVTLENAMHIYYHGQTTGSTLRVYTIDSGVYQYICFELSEKTNPNWRLFHVYAEQ